MGGLEWINTLFAFRKTLLGPTYGSPLEKIQILPRTSSADPQQHYLVYITKDKVWSPSCTRAPTCRADGPLGISPEMKPCVGWSCLRAERSWGRGCGIAPMGPPALPDSLFPSRWACRFCLSMATPTSPQPSFATRMVPLTLPPPMTGVTSLQPGGRSALL